MCRNEAIGLFVVALLLAVAFCCIRKAKTILIVASASTKIEHKYRSHGPVAGEAFTSNEASKAAILIDRAARAELLRRDSGARIAEP